LDFSAPSAPFVAILSGFIRLTPIRAIREIRGSIVPFTHCQWHIDR